MIRPQADQKGTIAIIDLTYKKCSLSSYEFTAPIEEITRKAGYGTEIIHHSQADELVSAKKHKMAILCGTALMDNSMKDWIRNLGWVLRSSMPVLGICAGMQLICAIHGCRLEEKHEIGLRKIRITEKSRLMSQDIEGYMLHSISVTSTAGSLKDPKRPEREGIGSMIRILARDSRCIQAVKVKGREIYGVQFHPEVRNPQIIRNFLRT